MSKAIGIDCQGGKGMAGYGVDVSPTLAAISHGTPHVVAIICFGSTQEHSTQRGYMKDCCPTINQAAGTSGDNKPFIVKSAVKDWIHLIRHWRMKCHRR